MKVTISLEKILEAFSTYLNEDKGVNLKTG